MPDVSYRFELDYLRDPRTGLPFPGIWLVLPPKKIASSRSSAISIAVVLRHKLKS